MRAGPRLDLVFGQPAHDVVAPLPVAVDDPHHIGLVGMAFGITAATRQGELLNVSKASRIALGPGAALPQQSVELPHLRNADSRLDIGKP